jgi:deoxyribodipyrimidine photo-lyase
MGNAVASDADPDPDPERVDPRVRRLGGDRADPEGRCVLYWMQRAQRGRDNPALDRAIDLANERRLPVLAVFGLTGEYPGAQRRHYRFLLEGLVDARSDVEARGVPLVVRLGMPSQVVAAVASEVRPALVVGDENPVRVARRWRDEVAASVGVPLELVDADVVVPTALFPREEYAARTLRPKIHAVWDDYLTPPSRPQPKARVRWPEEDRPRSLPIDPDLLLARLEARGVAEVAGYRGGTAEALRRLRRFVDRRLPSYATGRNEPTPYVTSELSAHLHFGHISPATIARAVIDSGTPRASVDAYLEELIVRRELAINFVTHNPRYDQLAGCPEWAVQSLARHARDPRPFLYTPRQLEAAETHDPLWNAAQREMVHTGRMHNYLRMYWAKQILLWSEDAETAFHVALDLNDRYEMDGRDPSGYAGVAWAIGGKHDRPWPERPVFGVVRSMTYQSTRKKFDDAAYIARVTEVSNR